jgi:hypothetical protein
MSVILLLLVSVHHNYVKRSNYLVQTVSILTMCERIYLLQAVVSPCPMPKLENKPL